MLPLWEMEEHRLMKGNASLSHAGTELSLSFSLSLSLWQCLSPRMDDPFCLSALRSPFFQLPGGGALPPIHPSAVHMHLPGVRYPGDFTHPSMSALQSER